MDSEPEPETIARKLGLPVAMVRDTLVLDQDAISLDASFSYGWKGLTDVLPAA